MSPLIPTSSVTNITHDYMKGNLVEKALMGDEAIAKLARMSP